MRLATTTLATALSLGTVTVATADIIVPYPAGRPYYPLNAIEDTAASPPPESNVANTHDVSGWWRWKSFPIALICLHLAFCSPKGRFLAGCGFGDHRQDRSRTCGFTASLHRRAHNEFLAVSWALGTLPQYRNRRQICAQRGPIALRIGRSGRLSAASCPTVAHAK